MTDGGAVMHTQIVKWGNGQGIRIPKSILTGMDIAVGDHVDLSLVRGKLIIQKAFRHKTWEGRAVEHDGELVSYEGETDWGDLVGREVW